MNSVDPNTMNTGYPNTMNSIVPNTMNTGYPNTMDTGYPNIMNTGYPNTMNQKIVYNETDKPWHHKSWLDAADLKQLDMWKRIAVGLGEAAVNKKMGTDIWSILAKQENAQKN